MKQMSPRQVVKWHRSSWLVKAEAVLKGQILLNSGAAMISEIFCHQ